jgi:hypothetical protein
LERQLFKVLESKLEKVKKALREMLKGPTTSPRKLAALAGKLVAREPAVLPAALFSRQIFQAMKGEASWDNIFPTPEVVKQTIQFWLDNLDRFS